MSIFSRNWRLKLIAVFFALTTWSVVAYADNPVKTLDIGGVPITAAPPPNTWVMVSQLPQITVTVSGLQGNLATFRATSLHASIDIASAHLGENLVHIRVDNTDSHLSIVQVQPASVDVVLDERDTVTKRVDLRAKNSPNNCCVALNQKATSNPDSVRLTGPKSVVAKAQPFVVVDLTEARTDVQLTVDVQLDGVDRKSAPLLTVSPKQVQATVPVSNVKKRAQVAVNVPHSGQVAPGYVISDVQYNPDTVIVEGDPGLISSLTTIDTDRVSLAGATSDLVQTVTLRPPAGITVIGSTQVTAHFFIKQNPDVQPSPTPSPTR